MTPESTIHLHTQHLRQLIEQLQIPRWWVAEKVGVHRRTLGRWLSGEVTSVKRSNAESLAECLKVPLTRLAIQKVEPATTNAARDQGRSHINHREVLRLFENDHRWKEYSALAKCTLRPDGSPEDLAKTYINISYFLMQESKIQPATQYLDEAKKITKETGDSWSEIQCALLDTQIQVKLGDLARATQSAGRSVETARAHQSLLQVKALIVEAECWYQFGDLKTAAHRLLSVSRKPQVRVDKVKLHQVFGRLALCQMEMMEYPCAIASLEESVKNATAANCLNSAACAELLIGTVQCLQNDPKASEQSAERAARLATNKSSNFFRENLATLGFHQAILKQEYSRAEEQLATKKSFYRDLPFYLAMTHVDYHCLQEILQDRKKSRYHEMRFGKIFSTIGASMRISWAQKFTEERMAEWGSNHVGHTGKRQSENNYKSEYRIGQKGHETYED